jgi:prepilin-type N-terminal cleavage/methylation domain-containing protein
LLKGNKSRFVTGFTLIETLVVVTILSVCAGGIISGFFAGLKLWDRAVNDDSSGTVFFLGMEQVARDLRQSVHIPLVGSQGTSSEVSFCAFDRDAAVKITYLFDAGQGMLVRRVMTLKDALSEEGKGSFTEKNVLPAGEVSFAYFFYDAVKGEGDWKDVWNKAEGMLSGVRLQGTYQGKEFVRKIFIPAS